MKTPKLRISFALAFAVLLLCSSASATIQWTNNATSVVANTGGLTAGGTSLTVTAGHGDRFPAVASPHYFMATLADTSGNREIVKVTTRVALSNTMTITRAQEGTSARDFAAGSLVELRITKNALDYLSKSADIEENHYVADASALDQGATTNSRSIKSLVDAIGTQQATIEIPHTGTGTTTTYTISTGFTIPVTISLRVSKGALISVSVAQTLTMNGIVQAGAYQIFTGAGTATVSTYPQDQAWWGSAQRFDVIPKGTSLQVFRMNASATAMEWAASSGELVSNLKPVVNATVNKLDIFTKTGGALPDANNIITVAIPDGNGHTFRSRAAAVASGTGQIVLADATNYWSKGSLDGEIKTAYLYAIWSTADNGIIWALSGYSGFTRVPAAGGTATDDDWFLLESNSSYTAVITDYCVCVAKIRYEYDTADTPDHTIQATVLNAPQVMWNPKSDYGKQTNLATTFSNAGTLSESVLLSVVVKQSGRYDVMVRLSGFGQTFSLMDAYLRIGSATYGSATLIGHNRGGVTHDYQNQAASCVAKPYLNAGDTIHLGISINGGDPSVAHGDNDYPGATFVSFQRID
jgi:hypothetical protein